MAKQFSVFVNVGGRVAPSFTNAINTVQGKLDGLNRHMLKRAADAKAAMKGIGEAGCTVPEIATITGHSLASVTRILERYLNRTKALAEPAIAKLELRMAG